MDKVVRKTTLKEQGNDYDYWMTKSYTERFNALEFLREQAYGKHVLEQGLQRVCRVVKRVQR